MQLSLQQIHNGMTVYLPNDDDPPDALIIVDKSDPHNIQASTDGKPLVGNTSGSTVLLCLVPGCEMYHVIYDNAEEAASSGSNRMEQHGYVVQHGCWNCAKMFLWYDYDSGSECYCDADGDRPPCNSSAIGEIKDSHIALFEEREAAKKAGIVIGDPKEVLKELQRVQEYQFAVWSRWADSHKVYDAGICGKWEHKKAKDPQLPADNS